MIANSLACVVAEEYGGRGMANAISLGIPNTAKLRSSIVVAATWEALMLVMAHS